MQDWTSAELKKKLRKSGFDVYRTLPDRVILAERIRDNLIMDSGVAALIGTEFSVETIIRVQQSHFPGKNDEQLREQTQLLATPFLAAGYQQLEHSEEAMMDPSEPENQLDTLYELRISKDSGDLTVLLAQLKQALAWQRSSSDEPAV